ncbi:MAG: NADH-quinone oxidoreductase subunit J [Bdellovibrionota bacterium]
MTLVDVFVAFCFLLGGVAAFFTAFHPNILYAAIALIGSLVSVAGLYGALGADFLAAAQLIIYVGGILIVILFAVMMSEDIYKRRFFQDAKKFVVPAVAAAVTFAGFAKITLSANWSNATKPDFEPTARAMGWALVGPYALVFQYVVVVLLSGLIGAVVIARPAVKMRQLDEELEKMGED